MKHNEQIVDTDQLFIPREYIFKALDSLKKAFQIYKNEYFIDDSQFKFNEKRRFITDNDTLVKMKSTDGNIYLHFDIFYDDYYLLVEKENWFYENNIFYKELYNNLYNKIDGFDYALEIHSSTKCIWRLRFYFKYYE